MQASAPLRWCPASCPAPFFLSCNIDKHRVQQILQSRNMTIKVILGAQWGGFRHILCIASCWFAPLFPSTQHGVIYVRYSWGTDTNLLNHRRWGRTYSFAIRTQQILLSIITATRLISNDVLLYRRESWPTSLPLRHNFALVLLEVTMVRRLGRFNMQRILTNYLSRSLHCVSRLSLHQLCLLTNIQLLLYSANGVSYRCA